MLDRIRIILIGTSHPGNIGSAARAMKTMGLSQLTLVAPETPFPHPKAEELASGAQDVLNHALISPNLATAIADCHVVVGTSARNRKIPWPLFSPREFGEKLQQVRTSDQIAIIFGCERTGLTNDELQQCHFHVQIPANPLYSSLNLAAAVQIIAYECRLASVTLPPLLSTDYRNATASEMESFFIHLERLLIDINFLKLNAPRKLMTRLRRFFLRTAPDVMEMNILRGILTAVDEAVKDKDAS